MSELITYIVNTVPNLEKMRRNLSIILPHVNLAVVCIGQRDEEAEAYLKAQEQVTLVYYPWQDSFKDAYQAAFDNAPTSGWHLRLDDDEVPSEGMLRSLSAVVRESEGGEKFDVCSFRCIDVHEGVVSDPSDYYREMFYRYNTGLHYEIDLHQSLRGLRGPLVSSQHTYYHHKSALSSLGGACRDFFICGVWADHRESFEYWYSETGEDPRINPGTPLVPQEQGLPYPLQDGFRIDAWHEMRAILKEHHPEVEFYKDLHKLITTGAVCFPFVEWANKHSEENDTRPHLHELYAFDKLIKVERT